MFDKRDRPKGLEFPSCLACNGGTRKSELVASIIGRVFPDAAGEAEKEELRSLLTSVSLRLPGVLEEMKISRAREKLAAGKYGQPSGGFLRLDGPQVTAHLEAFAAKIGFAFHFHATGKPVPPGGGVVAAIHSNLDAIEGKIPNEIFEMLGEPRTLIQGAKNVGDQFRFGTLAAVDANISMGFASFRRSFAVTTFASDAPSKLLVDGELPAKLFRPGDLQVPVPAPEFPSISFRWTWPR
jgi:hypothetical protein